MIISNFVFIYLPVQEPNKGFSGLIVLQIKKGQLKILNQQGYVFICFIKLLKLLFKSPPTMFWWRLIVFAESARCRRHLFLLSLKNPYSDYFQIFTVCILALGNLPGNFFFAFFSFSIKIQSYGAR